MYIYVKYYKDIIIAQENNEFEKLVIEIHCVNQGWHCFETANRFLNLENKYLQSYYLKQKNSLQEKLMKEYSEMINILPKDTTGFPSISIKEQYQFRNYTDACHIKGDK